MNSILPTLFWCFCLMWIPSAAAIAKTVRYELKVSRASVNLSGKQTVDWALMINGSIPAPTLEFTEGDDAEIVVYNNLNEEVSMHWHGLLLPSEMDGVAYVNTPPLLPKQSYTYKFKIRQHGTYWYHSHTNVQEQKGLYGGIIIHPRKPTLKYDKDVIVVLSDWSDEDALQILKNLRKDGDYYTHKKKSIRSIFGALRSGAFLDFLSNEMSRMGGMDLSDVGYDAFLINGRREANAPIALGDKKIRIRVINAAASTYFHVALGQSPMKVISADGVDIEPVLANELLMGMGETYDILFDVANGKSSELRATAQDASGFASLWFGSGSKEFAPTKKSPDLYASMNHGSGHQGHASAGSDNVRDGGDHDSGDHASHDEHEGHDMSDGDGDPIAMLTVDNLKSPSATSFPKGLPKYELRLVLGGDMERYVWHLNGKAIHEDKSIKIREGDIVRFTFVNETMMHHPMHLHGHFFRVLNGENDFSPLKHTVDVPPHGIRTIEFFANEPGQWMLHCHNLYHLKTGMARIIEYESFKPNPEIAMHQKHDPHQHDHVFYTGTADLFSNYSALSFKAMRTWDSFEVYADLLNYKRPAHFSTDIVYRRWATNFLSVYAGGRGSSEFIENKVRGLFGFSYLLPFLVESDVSIDSKGYAGANFEKRIQWTSDFYSDLGLAIHSGGDLEAEGSIMYSPAWAWAIGVSYKDHTWGGGLRLRF